MTEIMETKVVSGLRDYRRREDFSEAAPEAFADALYAIKSWFRVPGVVDCPSATRVFLRSVERGFGVVVEVLP